MTDAIKPVTEANNPNNNSMSFLVEVQITKYKSQNQNMQDRHEYD